MTLVKPLALVVEPVVVPEPVVVADVLVEVLVGVLLTLVADGVLADALVVGAAALLCLLLPPQAVIATAATPQARTVVARRLIPDALK